MHVGYLFIYFEHVELCTLFFMNSKSSQCLTQIWVSCNYLSLWKWRPLLVGILLNCLPLCLQFVPFREFMGGKYGNDLSVSQVYLAKEVLAEIPEQITGWMKKHGVQPKPPAEENKGMWQCKSRSNPIIFQRGRKHVDLNFEANQSVWWINTQIIH